MQKGECKYKHQKRIKPAEELRLNKEPPSTRGGK